MDGILSQLEITFWNAIIPLMTESRFVQLLVRKAVPLFEEKRLPRQTGKVLAGIGVLVFLIVGFRTYMIWAFAHPARSNPSAVTIPGPSAGLLTGLPTGQRNLLLITADDLKVPSPRLESAWLVLFVPPDAHLTLLPVFPSSVNNASKKDQALFDAFRLDGHHRPNEKFFEILRGREIWWSEYAILDTEALAGIMTRLGQEGGTSQIDETAYETAKMMIAGDQINPIDHPQIALLKQATFYQEMCWRAGRSGINEDILKGENFSAGLSGHYLVDTGSSQFSTELKKIQISSSGLFCEFPTIPMQPKASR